jgi:hypothetical protein
MLGGPQSRSGHGGEEKNSQALPGLEPPIIQRTTNNTATSYDLFLAQAGYEVMSSSLCNFLHDPSSSLLGPNILNTLFSKTLSLCSSLEVRD